MQWIDTPDSSNVAGFGYDPKTSVLTVEFKAGKTYTYDKVPPTIFQQMQKAPSVGSFFQQKVRPKYIGVEQ
jgi:hypothetical protein